MDMAIASSAKRLLSGLVPLCIMHSGRVSLLLLMTVAATLATAHPLHGQPVIGIPPTPSCETCRIHFDTLAVLGDLDGPGIVQEQSQIRMAPDGRFFVVSGFEPGIVKVFDRSGRYLTRFGRQGEGPGEYRFPEITPGENVIHVFDRLQGRVTALSSEFQIIDTKRLPFMPGGVARMDEGRFLLHGAATTPGHIGIPMHVYDYRTGTILRSFGAAAEMVSPRERGSNERRTVALAEDGTVWSAHWNRYRLERWDPTTGRLLATFEREVDWFPGFDRPPPGTLVERPPSTVLWRLSADRDGRLWILVHTAAEDWRPQPPASTDGAHAYISDAQKNEIYDSILEVIVPMAAEQRLYASQRFDGLILGFAAERIVYVYDEDEAGNPRYVILRLQISS